jgi:hypothetical protein
MNCLVFGIFGSMNQNKLKQLEKIKAQENALLDYQYEARKRLYHELEPLLFLLTEHSENALKRIENFAKAAKDGQLYWSSSPGYYMQSTLVSIISSYWVNIVNGGYASFTTSYFTRFCFIIL